MNLLKFLCFFYVLFLGFTTTFSIEDSGHILITEKQDDGNSLQWLYPTDPRKVVAEYCELDVNGNAFGFPVEAFWNIMSLYTNWGERGLKFEDIFITRRNIYLDTVHLIDSYKITDMKKDTLTEGKYSAKIEYNIIATFYRDGSYNLEKQKEVFNVILQKRDGRFKIVKNEPILYVYLNSFKRLFDSRNEIQKKSANKMLLSLGLDTLSYWSSDRCQDENYGYQVEYLNDVVPDTIYSDPYYNYPFIIPCDAYRTGIVYITKSLAGDLFTSDPVVSISLESFKLHLIKDRFANEAVMHIVNGVSINIPLKRKDTVLIPISYELIAISKDNNPDSLKFFNSNAFDTLKMIKTNGMFWRIANSVNNFIALSTILDTPNDDYFYVNDTIREKLIKKERIKN